MNYRLAADTTGETFGEKTVAKKSPRCLTLRLIIISVSPVFATALRLFLSSLLVSIANAQNRVDLEDLSVKGELLNDNRMRMTSREATRMQDRVRYRKNFRPEIIDEQEFRMPAAEPTSGSTKSGEVQTP